VATHDVVELSPMVRLNPLKFGIVRFDHFSNACADRKRFCRGNCRCGLHEHADQTRAVFLGE
jgi:hypothetical protein